MAAADQELRRELVTLLPRLRRFAWGVCGNPELADDLVQAACERAISRAHQWQPGTRLDSWLFQIIRSLHIDGRRSASVRIRYLETVYEETIEVPRNSPQEIHLQLQQVRSAISRLPLEQRTALLLVAVEEYSYREAAELLGIPIGTVASRVTRARESLLYLLREGANHNKEHPDLATVGVSGI